MLPLTSLFFWDSGKLSKHPARRGKLSHEAGEDFLTFEAKDKVGLLDVSELQASRGCIEQTRCRNMGYFGVHSDQFFSTVLQPT
jgi:hypothetical protein